MKTRPGIGERQRGEEEDGPPRQAAAPQRPADEDDRHEHREEGGAEARLDPSHEVLARAGRAVERTGEVAEAARHERDREKEQGEDHDEPARRTRAEAPEERRVGPQEAAQQRAREQRRQDQGQPAHGELVGRLRPLDRVGDRAADGSRDRLAASESPARQRRAAARRGEHEDRAEAEPPDARARRRQSGTRARAAAPSPPPTTALRRRNTSATTSRTPVTSTNGNAGRDGARRRVLLPLEQDLRREDVDGRRRRPEA